MPSWFQSLVEQITSGKLSLPSRVVLILVTAVLTLLLAVILQRLARWLLRRADPEVQLFSSRIARIGVLVAGLLAYTCSSSVRSGLGIRSGFARSQGGWR
jgi:hypothetical protein